VYRKPIYIVISGKKKHGKNFFADKVKELLRAEYISYLETAFATPIKNFCHDVFGIPMEDMETQEGKLKNTHLKWTDIPMALAAKMGCVSMTPGVLNNDGSLVYSGTLVNEKTGNDFITIRELLQMIGTDVFREGFYGPIWAEAPFRKKHTFTAAMQEMQADIVFITDCRFPNEVEEAKKNDALLVRVVRDDADEDGDAHISETALDDYKWNDNEVVMASTDDGRLDAFAKDVLLPRIKGRLYGH